MTRESVLVAFISETTDPPNPRALTCVPQARQGIEGEATVRPGHPSDLLVHDGAPHLKIMDRLV